MIKKLVLNISLLSVLISFQLSAISQVEAPPKPQTETQKDFNPKPASASLYNLGLKSYEQGDVTSAITYFKRAIDLDPEFVDAFYNLGAIYKKQKNYFNAIQALQKAIELSPTDYEATFELATCFLEDKKYDKAISYFSAIPNNFPKYNETLQGIEKANRYKQIDIAAKSGQTDIIKAPETQAQLLVDTLAKATTEAVNPSVQVQPVQNPSADQAQLLANNLAKPSQESFKEPVKTVSGSFNGPAGVAKDSKNNLYVANFTKDSIERINVDGSREIFIEKIGIKGPIGLAIDGADNLYIANYNADNIVRVTQNKEITVVADKVVRPYYLLFDSSRNKLFATVQGNDSLVEIDTASISKQPITSR